MTPLDQTISVTEKKCNVEKSSFILALPVQRAGEYG
jgi:hypothetical protein